MNYPWKDLFGPHMVVAAPCTPCTCPVKIGEYPQLNRCSDLVAWYEQAIARSLREHADFFTILTPCEVAHVFPNVVSNVVGCKELDAATIALEHLVSSGVLVRYEVKGEMRSINEEPCR